MVIHFKVAGHFSLRPSRQQPPLQRRAEPRQMPNLPQHRGLQGSAPHPAQRRTPSFARSQDPHLQ